MLHEEGEPEKCTGNGLQWALASASRSAAKNISVVMAGSRGANLGAIGAVLHMACEAVEQLLLWQILRAVRHGQRAASTPARQPPSICRHHPVRMPSNTSANYFLTHCRWQLLPQEYNLTQDDAGGQLLPQEYNLSQDNADDQLLPNGYQP